jgi:hypothetical protein
MKFLWILAIVLSCVSKIMTSYGIVSALKHVLCPHTFSLPLLRVLVLIFYCFCKLSFPAWKITVIVQYITFSDCRPSLRNVLVKLHACGFVNWHLVTFFCWQVTLFGCTIIYYTSFYSRLLLIFSQFFFKKLAWRILKLYR